MCRVAALNCILLQYSFGSLPYSFSLQAVLFTAILCSGLKVIAYGCGHYLLWRLFIVMLGYSKLTNFSFIVGFFINSTDTLMWKEVYIATWLPLNPLLCHRASLRRVGGGVSGVNGPHAPALVVLVSPTRTEHASGLTGKNNYNLMQLCLIILFVCCCSNGTCSGVDKQYRSCCVQVGSCMCWNVSQIQSLLIPNLHIRDCCATVQVCWLHIVFPSCLSRVLLMRPTSVLSSVQDSIISP